MSNAAPPCDDHERWEPECQVCEARHAYLAAYWGGVAERERWDLQREQARFDREFGHEFAEVRRELEPWEERAAWEFDKAGDERSGGSW